MEHPTVLVFVEFPDPKFPTAGFLNHLAYPDVELIGSYHLDENESVEEAEAKYDEEFRAELREQAERFEQQGVRTEFDLVFDHDPVEPRQKMARRDEVDAILIPGGSDTLGRVLIASRHTRNVGAKVNDLLNIVDRDDLISVGLIHIADPDDPEGEAEGERVLEEVASILTDQGVPSVQINREVRKGDNVSFELSQAARNYDLLVMGETEQDIGDEVFGPVGDYVVEEQDVPVLLVR
jgi:nucleotide-binding universal stress UspA family protein